MIIVNSLKNISAFFGKKLPNKYRYSVIDYQIDVHICTTNETLPNGVPNNFYLVLDLAIFYIKVVL